jgi:hypothetical protein
MTLMTRDEAQLASPQRFRAPDGHLYMPSYPWAVDYFSRLSDGIPHIGNEAARTKREAMRRAHRWIAGEPTRSATIRRRRDNREVMRYWVDTEGVQYLDAVQK